MTMLPLAAGAATPSFQYRFSVNGVLEEKGLSSESTSPYWWVNSGAVLKLENGIGRTLRGELPATSTWRLRYAAANAADTDNGYHPQNIFRLVTKASWQDAAQEAFFRITKYHLSNSDQRYESNGILLFNRYADAYNLYYTGLRVDGRAIIKKKINGTYYTMASVKVLPGTYDRATNPNLLPLNQWIGLKSDVRNLANGQVSITVYADIGRTGTWTKVAEAIDDGQSYGGAAITQAGHGGIRTDFMDVEFDDYQMSP